MKTQTQFFFLTLFAVALCLVQPASGQARSVRTTDLEMLQPPNTKGWVIIDQSTQTLECRINGKTEFKSICGTGVAFEWKNTTHNGRHHVLFKGGANYTNHDGVKMPYAIQFTEDSEFIHGHKNFLVVNGKGIPQAHGCVRTFDETAKRLDELLVVGDTVDVIGDPKETLETLGISDLFEETNEGRVRMKIAGPNPSPEACKKAREMALSKRLFYAPQQEKDLSKIRVGYPFIPDRFCVPFLRFQSLVLTPEEIAAGKHLTLDRAVKKVEEK